MAEFIHPVVPRCFLAPLVFFAACGLVCIFVLRFLQMTCHPPRRNTPPHPRRKQVHPCVGLRLQNAHLVGRCGIVGEEIVVRASRGAHTVNKSDRLEWCKGLEARHS